MYTLRYALAVGAAMLVATPSAQAQLRRSTGTTYPDASTLPTGMCRIWIEGAPVNRQPAPTDCETARRTQPRNSRIIYGTRRPASVYGNNGRYDDRGNGSYDEREARKRQQEREKWERKQQHEREKAWKKAHKGKNGDRDDDDQRDHDDRYGTRGTVQQSCIDANRDGVCDRSQSSTQTIPRGIPGTVQQGTTRRVCVDANRDGRCDDGGPLVRTLP